MMGLFFSRSYHLNILKTKSNFTVFIIAYFYSCFDLINLKYFNLSEQNLGKMIIASDSTIELPVLTFKTKN